MTSIQENFAYIIAQVAAITREANNSLDRYETKSGDVAPAEELLEMGILLACIRRCHKAADALSRRIPSPNQVPREYSDSVAEVANALFRFMESCGKREEIIGKNALGYRCETTV
jgi:hypothetical protein